MCGFTSVKQELPKNEEADLEVVMSFPQVVLIRDALESSLAHGALVVRDCASLAGV